MIVSNNQNCDLSSIPSGPGGLRDDTIFFSEVMRRLLINLQSSQNPACHGIAPLAGDNIFFNLPLKDASSRAVFIHHPCVMFFVNTLAQVAQTRGQTTQVPTGQKPGYVEQRPRFTALTTGVLRA